MEKCFVALFAYQLQIDEAFHDLLKIGIPPSNMLSFSSIGNLRGNYKIATIGTHPNDRFADRKSDLFVTLMDYGIPKEDVLLFIEGVRRGGKLALVIATKLEESKIIQLLQIHGALDLEARKHFSMELRERPSQGDSSSPFTKLGQQSTYADELAAWTHQHEAEHLPKIKVKAYKKPVPSQEQHIERNLNE